MIGNGVQKLLDPEFHCSVLDILYTLDHACDEFEIDLRIKQKIVHSAHGQGPRGQQLQGGMVEVSLPLQSLRHVFGIDGESGRIWAILQGVHDSNFPFGQRRIYRAMSV